MSEAPRFLTLSMESDTYKVTTEVSRSELTQFGPQKIVELVMRRTFETLFQNLIRDAWEKRRQADLRLHAFEAFVNGAISPAESARISSESFRDWCSQHAPDLKFDAPYSRS